MRNVHARVELITSMIAICLMAYSCNKKKPPEPQIQGAGRLANDSIYAKGTVAAAVMDIRTELHIPALYSAGGDDEEIKRAQAESATTQTIMVSEERGKLTFTTPNFYVPRGTEIRYQPTLKKYVLDDPAKTQYWSMTGSEIGSFLEGGPAISRANYRLEVNHHADKEKIAGFEAMQTDAIMSFDWKLKSRSGDKQGKVKVKLAIWHSDDSQLKPAWGRMIVDFFTVPFQDEQGQKVIEQLKHAIKFPVKWSMEVINSDQAEDVATIPPRMVTVAQKIDIRDVPRTELACPPIGFAPASSPYEFDEGGQKVSEKLLAKIPVKKNAPSVPAPPKKKGVNK